ncbi:metal ABC transporter solute-binding protein, Zn/Mn family [Selenomonas noxia]|uniref:metal ABC transporter solute-binding protein, Zn/Mn family n=1 Tax=Selenomonas noxia TaxID=135083 RepID=UPI0028899563|nr:zinc ABC transporter substrate-binding protein [Selenomonas noxia]
MNIKKNYFRLLLTFAVALTALFAVGCGSTAGDKSADAKKTVTVTTSFLQDMTKTLAGDYVNVELIIPAGEDPHLYVAQPADLEKIKKADLLLYHGLHFEGKMAEVLEKKGVAVTKNFTDTNINYMEQDGKKIVDPHFWFDVALYKQATETAAAELIKLVPEHEKEIQENLKKYLAELDALDKEITEKIAQIPADQRNLVTPHDAFNYFSRRYHVNVIAPQGVSTDSEVANADIEKTANYIVDHKVKAVFAESTTNPERMKKLQEVCRTKGFDVEIVGGEGNELFSDSLAPAGEKGDTYITMYRSNVDLIVSHLK